jgi:hypothetical protein
VIRSRRLRKNAASSWRRVVSVVLLTPSAGTRINELSIPA